MHHPGYGHSLPQERPFPQPAHNGNCSASKGGKSTRHANLMDCNLQWIRMNVRISAKEHCCSIALCSSHWNTASTAWFSYRLINARDPFNRKLRPSNRLWCWSYCSKQAFHELALNLASMTYAKCYLVCDT